jgi:hypothetical protein
MRSSVPEIGACCVGASEALTVGPAWVRVSAAGSFATSGAWCDGSISAPESSATASTDEVPESEAVADELLPVMAPRAAALRAAFPVLRRQLVSGVDWVRDSR